MPQTERSERVKYLTDTGDGSQQQLSFFLFLFLRFPPTNENKSALLTVLGGSPVAEFLNFRLYLFYMSSILHPMSSNAFHKQVLAGCL